MHLIRPLLFAAATLALSALLATTAQAQTKWDLPAAYPAGNFHSENLAQFAADVDKATAGKLKGMGVLAGVPDLQFILPNGQAAFLELKNAAGELSVAQIEFRDRVLACGCGYATARTMEEAEAVLARWLAAYGLKLRATLTRRAA